MAISGDDAGTAEGIVAVALILLIRETKRARHQRVVHQFPAGLEFLLEPLPGLIAALGHRVQELDGNHFPRRGEGFVHATDAPAAQRLHQRIAGELRLLHTCTCATGGEEGDCRHEATGESQKESYPKHSIN